MYLHEIAGNHRAKNRTATTELATTELATTEIETTGIETTGIETTELATTETAFDIDGFRRDVVNGLSGQPKTLPCKYFYDERGSQLFEQICQLDEYYLTRTELAIMRKYARQMGTVFSERVLLVEFGSGSSHKTRLLLKHLPRPLTYIPVDISHEHLYQTARRIAKDHPYADVLPLCADFTKDFALPREPRSLENVVVYFPGSTIGNLTHQDSCRLLRNIARLCGSRGALIIGIDLQKKKSIIEAAYNDRRGVTAQFNLNLLVRINRQLKADFDVDCFAHCAEYNQALGRIEMHLISRKNQTVRVSDQWFSFAAGETICTEYSHKYRIDQFAAMASTAGLTLERHWTDSQELFAVLHFAVGS